MMTWRFLPPLDGSGALHMAADIALMEAVRAGNAAPVLRFYRWTPPGITLGRFQPAKGDVHLDACTRLGYDVVTRPTGGRAILHDHEVTFSIIVAERDLPGAGRNIMESYRTLAEPLIHALRALKLPAELVDHQATARAGDPPSVSAVGNPACFAAKARCDVMVAGKKIIGSAQMRKDGVILQQNSLPLRTKYAEWETVFYRSNWQAIADAGAVDLWTATGRPVSEEEVVAALREGFAATLGIHWQDEVLSADEHARARELAPTLLVKG
jgi:lipoyl(octanoyl) transferase